MEKQQQSVNTLEGQYSSLDGEEPLTLTKKQFQSTLMTASLIYAYQQPHPAAAQTKGKKNLAQKAIEGSTKL